MKRLITYILTLSMFLAVLAMTGCFSTQPGPRALLDKYFTSAQKQDYATTYTCYYKDYQTKISKDEFLKNRKDASVVQAYKILDLTTDKDTGKAIVEITFAPSEKLKRSQPVTVKVQEDLVKEGDGWKIKVW